MNYQKFIEAFNQMDTYSRLAGIRLTRLEEGRAEAELTVTPSTSNIMGMVHGGALFTLADIAAGTAVISHGSQCVTLNADIHYIRPITAGRAMAKAEEIHYGGRTAISRVSITDEAGRLLCTCTSTMFLTGAPIPAEFLSAESVGQRDSAANHL